MQVKSFFTRSIILFFLLVFSNQAILAQYHELQNDSNISWIAEFSMDHSFSFNPEPHQLNVVKLVKFYNEPSNMNGANSDNWIINWVLQNATDGFYECYKDDKLTQRIPNSDLKYSTVVIDTIITFYPETFEETIEINRKELGLSSIKSLRTKQIIYYNQKNGNFETKLIAVAPLMKMSPTEVPLPLFWIKMDTQFPSNFDTHDPNITWGALIDTRGKPLDLNLVKVIKNENNFDFRIFLQQQALNLEKPVESGESYGCNKFLNKEEVGYLYNAIDTIITFYPSTYEETVEIAKHELDPKDLSHYRLVQEWYYDSKKRKLMNRLKAVCPLYFIQYENGVIKFAKAGSLRYGKPLYYIRYN